MEDSTNGSKQAAISIKERLLIRLKRAKETVGPSWRQSLAEHDEFFDTLDGARCMDTVAQAFSNPRRGSVDRIARVTLALEKIAGIESPPIV
jgi:hypothetical protein